MTARNYSHLMLTAANKRELQEIADRQVIRLNSLDTVGPTKMEHDIAFLLSLIELMADAGGTDKLKVGGGQ